MVGISPGKSAHGARETVEKIVRWNYCLRIPRPFVAFQPPRPRWAVSIVEKNRDRNPTHNGAACHCPGCTVSCDKSIFSAVPYNPPESHRNRNVATRAPAIRATIKNGASAARIRANVSDKARAKVTAGSLQ
jgi:hypothetical protein